MNYKAPKGTKDILPAESYKWQYIEDTIRTVVRKYGILEARSPVIEHTELFLRGVGDTTDIVQKEMYTFLDKGDRSITLKPEGTAGIVRLFVENGLCNDAQPTKMYYLNNPVFRYERPQAGRLREHHQFGVEIFGASLPSADAECIMLVMEVLSTLGLKDLKVKLNSIGCQECRKKYQEALHSYLSERYDSLCETCKDRFEKNPLRILDCKNPECQKLLSDIPKLGDYICDDCKTHFNTLKELLTGMNIPFEVDPLLVRGLDYYTKTVFEIVSNTMNPQIAICGGGRYDYLVKQLGGPDCPGVGFGVGMERLLSLMESNGVCFPEKCVLDLYVAPLDERYRIPAFTLCQGLRQSGLKADTDHVGRSIKAQIKYADKVGANYVIALGEDEINNKKLVIKDMHTGESQELPYDEESIFSYIKNGDK